MTNLDIYGGIKTLGSSVSQFQYSLLSLSSKAKSTTCSNTTLINVYHKYPI